MLGGCDMYTELILFNNNEQTISARKLYEIFNIKTRFNDWFNRVIEYGFVENLDFYSKMSKLK